VRKYMVLCLFNSSYTARVRCCFEPGPRPTIVAESSVGLILETCEREGIKTEIYPAMSFIDAVFMALGIDPIEGFQLLDGLQLDRQKPDPDTNNLIAQVYDEFTASEAKLQLMRYYNDEQEVYVVRAAGIPDIQRIVKIPLFKLDRIDWIDYLTTIFVPKVENSEKKYYNMNNLAAIVKYKFKKVIDEHPHNENYHITVEQISDFLKGSIGLGRRLLWRNLVDGQIDADRADYLLRDSYHTGTSYGNYDLKRLLVTLTILEEPETQTPVIAVEEGGVHAAEALIIARYLMFTQVYFHHTRRAYDYHIAETMKGLLFQETGRSTFLPPTSPKNIDNYLEWDDWKVCGLLSQGEGGRNGDLLKERKHHRCIFCTPEVPTEDELKQSNAALGKLSELIRFVDSPEKSWYSIGEKDILIERDVSGIKEVVPLSSISSVVRGLLPIRQRRIYVAKEDRDSAKLKLKGKEG
jgi:HD superfamily phosphohydrolase